jgi:transposase
MAEQQRPSRRGEIPRVYPAELKERAVRMVFETAADQGEWHGAVGKVAKTLGVGAESLRNWVHHEEVQRGLRPGLTDTERARLRELERENRDLRRANEILKSAAVFFGAELDRRSPR